MSQFCHKRYEIIVSKVKTTTKGEKTWHSRKEEKTGTPSGQEAGAILLWGDMIPNEGVAILTHQMV
jgi:hypothetical protein